ncbi:class I SAM-dependent rRNA methyltransferase [Winogradskyella aurantia]|uniref:SAM-dependent methyltransferase n=1 Tax=Winogradskyella aurantia TaxID=1915063 RepID=A0A265UXD6_9FLAO|nr:class I SAM-dependent rRNA methyltransferase [Winogradskyella aurantia]OZV69975.1 SAM-dependent methyltransferase [Winogradskyella aurantia]
MSKRLAVKLTSAGEKSVRSGHPWIFSNSISQVSGTPKTGDLAIIFSKQKNKLIGLGLYDEFSPIRIKLIHSGTQKVTLNKEFFYNKILMAYKKRAPLLATETNSYRLIFGENDGFPGLIADVYNKVLVVKLYSEIWLPYLESILDSLYQVSKTKTIVIRLSRSLQKSRNHNLKDGQIIRGVLENNVIQFVEHGIRFSANVILGHKTGYFLDHRENRRRVGEMSYGKTVLDVFSYAGGFSVHALAGGAKEVTSVDISKQALEMAKENAKLNPFSGVHDTIVGDAFEVMKNLIIKGKQFDVVIIDPPSFAKRKSEIELAKKKYLQLAELGLQLTAKKGLLILASCSSRIIAQSFFDLNEHVLNLKSRAFDVILKTQHDIDHPVAFEEGAYLKCAYYKLRN